MPGRWHGDADEYAGWTYGHAFSDAAGADQYTHPLSHAHAYADAAWAD
jgi:hypothetical protein